MKNLVPSTPAPIFTLSATVVGFLLIDDLTPAEQNSLGNWFMLLAQVLCTNAAQQQLINNRTGTSTNQNTHIINDNNLTMNDLSNILSKMQNEINNMKNP